MNIKKSDVGGGPTALMVFFDGPDGRAQARPYNVETSPWLSQVCSRTEVGLD